MVMEFLMLLLVFIPLINGNNNIQELHETPAINNGEYRYIGPPVPIVYENYFIYFKNLNSIYMTNNYIQTIENHAFRNLTELEMIDFSLNQITTLPVDIFSDTPKLEVINLSNNNLKTLEKHLFANLTFLRSINFQSNNISYIEEKCFLNVPSLKAINLAKNNLKTLQLNIIDNSRSLNAIYLGGNPWNCDPKLCQFMHTVVTRFWEEPFVPICYTPNGIQGATWKEVIDLSMPAVVTDLKENVAVNKINFQCHTCTNTTLSWRWEDKHITNKVDQMSNKYSTVSKFVQFKNLEGNYTCIVAKCSTCFDSVEIILKPASTTTRIITWTFVIILMVSVTVYFIFFYGKSRKCGQNGSEVFSLFKRK